MSTKGLTEDLDNYDLGLKSVFKTHLTLYKTLPRPLWSYGTVGFSLAIQDPLYPSNQNYK